MGVRCILSLLGYGAGNVINRVLSSYYSSGSGSGGIVCCGGSGGGGGIVCVEVVVVLRLLSLLFFLLLLFSFISILLSHTLAYLLLPFLLSFYSL